MSDQLFEWMDKLTGQQNKNQAQVEARYMFQTRPRKRISNSRTKDPLDNQPCLKTIWIKMKITAIQKISISNRMAPITIPQVNQENSILTTNQMKSNQHNFSNKKINK